MFWVFWFGFFLGGGDCFGFGGVCLFVWFWIRSRFEPLYIREHNSDGNGERDLPEIMW